MWVDSDACRSGKSTKSMTAVAREPGRSGSEELVVPSFISGFEPDSNTGAQGRGEGSIGRWTSGLAPPVETAGRCPQ